MRYFLWFFEDSEGYSLLPLGKDVARDIDIIYIYLSGILSGVLKGGCREFNLDMRLSYWIWILSFRLRLGGRLVITFSIVWCEFYYFFFDSGWVEFNRVVFVDDAWAKLSNWLYVFFPCGICVYLREVIYRIAAVFIWYFVAKVAVYFCTIVGFF